MIEQQYYTRERGGVFNNVDGYDTVAISPGIKKDFIMKYLHPICHYDVPYELGQKGEKSESKYPKNFVVYPAATGELIIGQAIFKATDFTGLRSTFFMHNYILSVNERRRYIKEPEKIFGITAFATGYDIKDGQVLPTLAGIEYDKTSRLFRDKEILFQRLKMDNDVFNVMLEAAILAVNSKRKIYIALDEPVNQMAEVAKALMYHLYTELPWSVAEKLGISTYANEVEPKKNIHITFVPHSAIEEPEFLKGKPIIFDFCKGKILNFEQTKDAEPYLKIAPKYRTNKTAWETFNRWCDMLGGTLFEGEDTDIKYYSKIITLIDINTALKSGATYDISSTSIRQGLFKKLYTQIQRPDLIDDVKRELIEILEFLINLLSKRIVVGDLLQEEELDVIMKFKLEYNAGSTAQEAHFIQIMISVLEAASRQDKNAYVYEVMERIKEYPDTYVKLNKELISKPEARDKITYSIVNQKLEGVYNLKTFYEVLGDLDGIESLLIRDTDYKNKVMELFHTCLDQDYDLLGAFYLTKEWRSKHKSSQVGAEIEEECEKHFLRFFNINEIENEAVILSLDFSKKYDNQTYRTITDYQKLKNDLKFLKPNKIDVNQDLQVLVKRLYKNRTTVNDFYVVFYAFLEAKKVSPVLDLKAILEYLYDQSTDLVVEFVAWSKGQRLYIDIEKFDDDVVEFFETVKEREEELPAALIRSKLCTSSRTKDLGYRILHIGEKQRSKFAALFNAKVVLLVAALAVAGAGGYTLVMSAMRSEKAKETFNVQDINKKITQEAVPNAELKNNEEVQDVIAKTQNTNAADTNAADTNATGTNDSNSNTSNSNTSNSDTQNSSNANGNTNTNTNENTNGTATEGSNNSNTAPVSDNSLVN